MCKDNVGNRMTLFTAFTFSGYGQIDFRLCAIVCFFKVILTCCTDLLISPLPVIQLAHRPIQDVVPLLQVLLHEPGELTWSGKDVTRICIA